MRALMLYIVLYSSLAIAACGKSPAAPAPVAQLLQASIIDGENQVDTVGRQLATAIVAQVGNKLSANQPVSGVILNWVRANDIPGDRVLSHADSAAIADSTFLGAALTDASGAAQIRLSLSTRAGGQHIIAFAIDADGNRVTHAGAPLTAVADRATHTLGARLDTVIVQVGAPVLDNVSYAAAYDQYGNFAGPLSWVAAAGWTVLADTCWATKAGVTDMQLVRDGAHAHVVLKAVP